MMDNLTVGSRVQIPSYSAHWLAGKRFGLIARIVTNYEGAKVALVALDKGGTVRCTARLAHEGR